MEASFGALSELYRPLLALLYVRLCMLTLRHLYSRRMLENGLLAILPNGKWAHLLDQYGDDLFDFLHTKAPRILGVLIISAIILVLVRILRTRLVHHAERAAVAGIRAQQIR